MFVILHRGTKVAYSENIRNTLINGADKVQLVTGTAGAMYSNSRL